MKDNGRMRKKFQRLIALTVALLCSSSLVRAADQPDNIEILQ